MSYDGLRPVLSAIGKKSRDGAAAPVEKKNVPQERKKEKHASPDLDLINN
jgi:hypothetical protein